MQKGRMYDIGRRGVKEETTKGERAGLCWICARLHFRMDRDVASSCQKEILHRGFKLCKRNGVESGTLVKFSMGNARITFHTRCSFFTRG